MQPVGRLKCDRRGRYLIGRVEQEFVLERLERIVDFDLDVVTSGFVARRLVGIATDAVVNGDWI